jgi:hypothetical protein
MEEYRRKNMRVAFGVFALALALVACGPSNKTTAATSVTPAVSGAPYLGGGPVAIERAADKSTANIWVQILYGAEQKYVIEDKTTRQTITYNRERILFRFDCNKYTYAILERRLMGAGEDVAESIKTPITSDKDWRPVHDGGVTAVTLGPACQAVIKAP